MDPAQNTPVTICRTYPLAESARLFIEETGEELSAKPMLEYFEPLMEWLKKENAGREVGW